MPGQQTTFADQRDIAALIPAALDDMGLDPYTFRVYAHIARRAGGKNGCYASQASMADTCCMSTRKLRDCLSTLEELNLIEEDADHPSGDSRRRRYFLLPIPAQHSGSYEIPAQHSGNNRNDMPTKGVPTKDKERVDSPDVEADTPKILYDDEQTVYTLTREFALAAKANRHPIPKAGTQARDRWLVAMDRLLRLGPPGGDDDPFTVDEVRAIIDFATTDIFWKPNIQSVPTLREQASRLLNQAGQVNGKPQTAWDGSPMDRGMRLVT